MGAAVVSKRKVVSVGKRWEFPSSAWGAKDWAAEVSGLTKLSGQPPVIQPSHLVGAFSLYDSERIRDAARARAADEALAKWRRRRR
jgi:hypothetical protein